MSAAFHGRRRARLVSADEGSPQATERADYGPDRRCVIGTVRVQLRIARGLCLDLILLGVRQLTIEGCGDRRDE